MAVKEPVGPLTSCSGNYGDACRPKYTAAHTLTGTPTGTHRLRNKLLAYQAQHPMNTHCKILSTHIAHRSGLEVRFRLLGALAHVNVQVQVLLLPVHLHSVLGLLNYRERELKLTANEKKAEESRSKICSIVK